MLSAILSRLRPKTVLRDKLCLELPCKIAASFRETIQGSTYHLLRRQFGTTASPRLANESNESNESGQYRLDKEQQVVFDLVLEQGKNVFFTGPAGTGKSELLKRIIKGLRIKYLADEDTHDQVAITASTGLAACNIGGTTIHQFAGIGTGKAPTEKLIKEILSDKRFNKLERWEKVKVLIIDEVSMVDAALFDKLDLIARAVRQVNRPFGGIQLVITGDFFQLPPVTPGSDDGSPRFCFEARAWQAAIQYTIGFTRIHRQDEAIFTKMLNEMREGCLTPSSVATFRSLSRPLPSLGGNLPEPTELFPLRRQADWANTRRMQKLTGPHMTFVAEEGGIIGDSASCKRLLNGCIAPEVLQLKEGAQVMLIKNMGRKLVNGSQGQIIGFANRETFHRWGDGKCELYCSNALSMAGDKMREDYLSLYPVVRFQCKGENTRLVLCVPEKWAVQRWVRTERAESGWVALDLATRTQVPLIPAWALSIHKSQGQTLDFVKVDLEHVFETGQAYVALSRTKRLEGLQVLNFDPNKVTVNPKVKAFYENLSRHGGVIKQHGPRSVVSQGYFET